MGCNLYWIRLNMYDFKQRKLTEAHFETSKSPRKIKHPWCVFFSSQHVRSSTRPRKKNMENFPFSQYTQNEIDEQWQYTQNEIDEQWQTQQQKQQQQWQQYFWDQQEKTPKGLPSSPLSSDASEVFSPRKRRT